ncbi:hypothetical protein SCAR479_10420 [Seiridium cardinale]|uniref:Uncharacterized protein n=1 Tax=Seiridium cardinale TaxID=138064 RepID=A0ABR2XGV7_9PEZI
MQRALGTSLYARCAAFSTSRSHFEAAGLQRYLRQLVSSPKRRVFLASGSLVLGIVDYEIWTMFAAKSGSGTGEASGVEK